MIFRVSFTQPRQKYIPNFCTGTLFYLTTRIGILVWPFYVTTGSAALAAVSIRREFRHTLFTILLTILKQRAVIVVLMLADTRYV